MIDVRDCLGLSDQELAVQINLRRDLIGSMVGSLYPGMVNDQIVMLWEFIGKNTLERLAMIDEVDRRFPATR